MKPYNLSMRDYFMQCHNCPYDNDPASCNTAQKGWHFCKDFVKEKTRSYKIVKTIWF